MKQAYKLKDFRKKSLDRICDINEIIEEYQSMGYRLTVRQLYYQLVSRNLVPNNQNSYKRICDLVGDARLAALIDWDMIIDRGRAPISNSHWENPGEILQDAVESFAIDKWKEQPNYVEVMCEKDALTGVLMPVCSRLDVTFTANRGYASLSLLNETGGRLAMKAFAEGKAVHLLYFGDHDPSGLDMDRDLTERLSMFSGLDLFCNRLALTMEQVDDYSLPRNPAKLKDTRAAGYISKYGGASWELDALDPRVIDDLVTRHITELRDGDLWAAAVEQEEEMKAVLSGYIEQYDNDK